VPQLALLREELAGVFSGKGDVTRNGPHQLDDVGEVILVPGVILSTVRFKEVVTGGQLEGHTSSGPDVSWRPVPSTEQDLKASVLPSLDVFREMMRHPTRVAQVSDLDLKIRSLFHNRIVLTGLLVVGALRGGIFGVAVMVVSGSVGLLHLVAALVAVGVHLGVAVAALDTAIVIVFVRIDRLLGNFFRKIFKIERLTAGRDLRELHVGKRLPLLDVHGLSTGAAVTDNVLALVATLLLLAFVLCDADVVSDVGGNVVFVFVVDFVAVTVAAILLLLRLALFQ